MPAVESFPFRSTHPKRVTNGVMIGRIVVMREMNLIETGYLACLLLLSLVLPLMMSLRGPHNETARRSCLKTVWVGQLLCAFAGVVVLASGAFAPYAATFGFVSCAWCANTLRRQFRATDVA